MSMEENDSNSLTSEIRGGQTPRGGRSGLRGRGRGTTSPGRGFRPYTDLQVYERCMVRQGGELQWSKWETGAKAALRPAYGVQVESITRVLRDEEHPIQEPELSARNLNTPEKIEFHKLTMRKYEDWKKGAEIRREIRMTLLDKCTQQVKKAFLAAHPAEEVEHLECKVSVFMTWLRKAAQDPTMSTYMRKSRAMSDYAVAKQFLSETDEA